MIIFTLLSSALVVDSATADDVLLSVDVVVRHADRAASKGWATPESPTILFRGNDQLTDSGLDNSFSQGKDFRKRYVKTGFLDERYLPGEFYLRSSPVDRCLMSSASFSHAMFSKTSDKRPITPPIRSNDAANDWTLFPHLECVDGWQDVRDKFNITTTVEQGGYPNAASEALQESEWDCPTVPSELFDAIVSELPNKLISMPDDYQKCAKKKGKRFMFSYIELLAGAGASFNPIRLKRNAGLLVNELLENFVRVANCSTPCSEKKIRVYYTHDVVVLAVAHVFGFLDQYQGITPAFSSAIVFETYMNASSAEVYVKIFRKDGQEADFEDTHNCDRDCTLTAINQTVTPYVTPNIPCESTPHCQDCAASLITLAIDGNDDHTMDGDVTDRWGRCATRTFTCRGTEANIEVNDGANGVVTNHTDVATFTVICNEEGKAWMANGVVVTQLECASG